MPEQRFVVFDDTAAYAVRHGMRAFATSMGFSSVAVSELLIVVSELASNILKYGVRGSIEWSIFDDPKRGRGILVLARDQTPPFDLARCVLDGHDANGKIDLLATRGRKGIGAGLGAISRFSDELSLEPIPEGGKYVRVVRFVRKRGASPG